VAGDERPRRPTRRRGAEVVKRSPATAEGVGRIVVARRWWIFVREGRKLLGRDESSRGSGGWPASSGWGKSAIPGEENSGGLEIWPE